MRTLLKITAVLFISTLVFSCEKKEDLSVLKNQVLSYETFFEKVSKIDIKTNKEKNIIYINYEWNRKDGTIKYLSSEEKEPESFFVLVSEDDVARRVSGDKYSVTCVHGEEEWEKECSGTLSCGKLIKKCLDEDRRATICKKKLAYVPQTRSFYLF